MTVRTWLAGLCLLMLSASAWSSTIRLTIYGDGDSCPAECDAHVVFDAALNKTEFAHLPSTPEEPFSACANGSLCEICITSGHQECLTVMYRGAGPSKNTFDLTPAFFRDNCPSDAAHPTLQAKCKEIDKAVAALKGRINCLRETSQMLCAPLIEAAKEKRDADLPLYQQCKALGEKAFNKTQKPAMQRKNNCTYERFGTGGPNSKGVTWSKLLPAACSGSTFVGRNGLDCCTGVATTDGPLLSECRDFWPTEPPPKS